MHRLSPLLLLACSWSTADDVPVATAARGPFDVTLSVNGELEAKNQKSIDAPDLDVSIKLNWLVEDGKRVEEGEVLVELDRVELEKSLESARDSLVMAETKIGQARSQLDVKVADAEADVVRAELALKRAKMHLTESETVPRVDREGAKLDVVEQEMAIERAKSTLKAVTLQGEAEIALLTLEAANARRSVESVERQLEKTTLRAPAPGLVIREKSWSGGSLKVVDVGDTVWSGSTLLSLPDLSAMQVVAWVHEVDSARVAVGQSVKLVLDAHKEVSHPGTVEKVADLAVARDRGAARHLKVTVGLAETTPEMKPGMSTRCELLLQHLDDVVSVPIEATHRGPAEGGKPPAWVWTRGGLLGWEKRTVELGAESDTHVVVTSGLEAGEEVALVDPEKWAAGEKPGAAEPASPAPQGAP